MRHRKWSILSSEYVLESPWYRLRRDVCRLPDGTIVDPYYVREHAGFSVVFPLTPDKHVVFIRQYKHGIGDFVLELPAGALEQDEDPLACGRRELEEETGYVAPVFEHVTDFVVDSTSSNGKLYLYLARDAQPLGRAAPDVTENIETVLVPLTETAAQIRAGRVCVQSHVAAVYTVLDRLGSLGL